MRLFFLSLSFVVSTCLGAVNITWIGGSGHWDVASNWSTGTIPTLADNVLLGNNHKVIIPKYYNAFANRVTIGGGTLFAMDDYSSLTITTSAGYGIVNSGEFIHEGNLIIQGDINTTIGIINHGDYISTPRADMSISQVKLAINNFGDFQNGSDITISNVSQDLSTSGIRNNSGANFRNNRYGDIDMTDLDGRGIFNDSASFRNDGRINFISNIGTSAFENYGPFVNTGRMNFWSFQNFGINNNNAITNSGRLYFSGGGTNNAAFQNFYGSLTNETTGTVEIDNVSSDGGLSAYGNTSVIINDGTIEIDHNTSASLNVSTDASLRNTSIGEIIISGTASSGIYVYDATLTNEGGTIHINKTSGDGLGVSGGGQFDNLDCGLVTTSAKIECFTNGLINNEAWFEIGDISSPHSIFADFENYGLIYDPFATLTGLAVDNFGIIVDPLPTGVTEGQPVNNALWSGNLSNNITVATTWTKGVGGASLGTYDQNPNIFTPSNGSEGNTAVWAEFAINNCNSRVYEIEVPGGIQGASPLQDHPSLNLSPDHTNSKDTEELSIFPNPILESFVVQIPTDAPSSVELSFIQLDGKQLFRQTYKEIAGQQLQLTRPAHISAGLYFLRLTSPNGWTSQSKIILK